MSRFTGNILTVCKTLCKIQAGLVYHRRVQLRQKAWTEAYDIKQVLEHLETKTPKDVYS